MSFFIFLSLGFVLSLHAHTNPNNEAESTEDEYEVGGDSGTACFVPDLPFLQMKATYLTLSPLISSHLFFKFVCVEGKTDDKLKKENKAFVIIMQ